MEILGKIVLSLLGTAIVGYLAFWLLGLIYTVLVGILLKGLMSNDLEKKWDDNFHTCATQGASIYAIAFFLPFSISDQFEIDISQYYTFDVAIWVISYTLFHPIVFILYLKFKSK